MGVEEAAHFYQNTTMHYFTTCRVLDQFAPAYRFHASAPTALRSISPILGMGSRSHMHRCFCKAVKIGIVIGPPGDIIPQKQAVSPAVSLSDSHPKICYLVL